MRLRPFVALALAGALSCVPRPALPAASGASGAPAPSASAPPIAVSPMASPEPPAATATATATATPTSTSTATPTPTPTATPTSTSTATATPTPTATATATSTPTPAPPSACTEQAPQDFLIRGNFLKEGPSGNERAIQYRTDTYGYFKGFGHPAPGAQSPGAQVVDTTFMGLPVKMHRKVVPALACVEAEIRRACVDHPYTPGALAGIRYRNTYRGGEVTNHAYGIAIDIDPGRNSCCGCVKPWNEAPACTRPAKTEYDRMAMPECWVHAFERFGFYWLGHDRLRDTMHFEFLGDPDKIPAGAPDKAVSSTGQR